MADDTTPPKPKSDWKKIGIGIVMVAVLGAAIVALFLRFRKSRAVTRAPGHWIKYWKRRGDDILDDLDITLIETSDGSKILDERDHQGNGVVTLYLDRKHKGGPKCMSLVKQKAQIYNRLTLELMSTECLSTFSSIKRDFRREVPVTVPVGQSFGGDLARIIGFLRQQGIIQ